jgi:hypothetical protein
LYVWLPPNRIDYAHRALDSDEEALRQKAHEKLRSGELPREAETRLWAGPGIGLPCGVCGNLIGRHETEYEAQFPAGYALRIVRFHRMCHVVWQLERVRE